MTVSTGSSSANSDKNRRVVSELGHAKNVANFNTLIAAAESYGEKYSPPRLALQLPQLYTIAIIAQDKLASVTIQNTAYKSAVNVRRESFCGLQELSDQIVMALEACKAPDQKIAAAKEYNRKINGIRIPSDPPTPNRIKLTYDQAVQLLEGLIAIVATQPNYAPADPKLTVASLKAMLEWLIQQNKAKSLAFEAIKNIRKERNVALYHPETGLVAVAEEVKKYILSIFELDSAEIKQIGKLKFKKPKVHQSA